MSLSNPGTQSIIVSTFPVDGAAIEGGTPGVTGFPSSNVLDPQPRTIWRANTDAGTGGTTTPFIILDLLTSTGQAAVDFTPAYNYFGVYFHNSWSGSDATQNIWRVQTGDTSSGTGNFDSGNMNLWAQIGGLNGGTFKDSMFYHPPGATSHHLVSGQVFGGGRFGSSVTDRFVRIGFNLPDQANNGNIFDVGRIVIGKAILVFAVAPGERATPVGTPAKPVVSWDVVTDRTGLLELYTLVRNRGSRPRVLRSWGFDTFPLDGAGTVVAVQDVEAVDPWVRHQGTVYGYLESVSPVSVRGDLHRVRLTFMGIG